MATSIRFRSITHQRPVEPCALEPAPSVNDWDAILEGLNGVEAIENINDLLEGPHKIRGSYRGWIMWLYPNVRFYRREPKTFGGNGFAGVPPPGLEEKVTVRTSGQEYDAIVEFM